MNLIIIIPIIAIIGIFGFLYTMYEVPENLIKEISYNGKIFYQYEFSGTKHLFKNKIIGERRTYILFGKK